MNPFLVRLYSEQPLTVDALPYSEELHIMTQTYNANTGACCSPREVYMALLQLRKSGLLIRKGARS